MSSVVDLNPAPTAAQAGRAPRPPRSGLRRSLYDVIAAYGGEASLSQVMHLLPEALTKEHGPLPADRVLRNLSHMEWYGYLETRGHLFKIASIEHYAARRLHDARLRDTPPKRDRAPRAAVPPASRWSRVKARLAFEMSEVLWLLFGSLVLLVLGGAVFVLAANLVGGA